MSTSGRLGISLGWSGAREERILARSRSKSGKEEVIRSGDISPMDLFLSSHSKPTHSTVPR